MMKYGIAKSLIWTVGFMASTLVVSLVHPGPSEAASPKVPVCHREGNGSFHLITVASQAVTAHRAHGDALPGETVPGHPGDKFTDTCTQVVASICPCDFRLTTLAELGIDGNPENTSCLYDDAVATEIFVDTPPQPQIGTTFAVANYEERECATAFIHPDGTSGIPQDIFDLTPAELTACAADLRAAASTLGIPAFPHCP